MDIEFDTPASYNTDHDERDKPHRPLREMMDPTEARMRFPFAWAKAQQQGVSMSKFMERDIVDVVMEDISPILPTPEKK